MNLIKNICCAAAMTACCLFPAATPAAFGQTHDVTGPPPVLVVNREFTKPGRGGSLHTKSESAFVAAAKAGKAPYHYLALTSLSGPDRALFLSGYDSLAGYEADDKAMDMMPSTGAALDHVMMGDGDLLSATDSSVWMLRSDLSLTGGSSLIGARYVEIEQFMVKPGHMHEWDELVKMYMDGFKKIPGAHWTTFQQIYGTNSNSFVAITMLPSLKDADAEWASYEPFSKAMGADGMKKLGALESASVESEQTNLFRISPKMSIPLDEWVKAEPDFWAPKKPVAPAKKPAPGKK